MKLRCKLRQAGVWQRSTGPLHGSGFESSKVFLYGKRQEPRTIPAFGRSVIIGSQKTQIYQRFAGSQQEVFILKNLKFENNAAYVDSRRRFYIAQLIILL